MDDLQRYIENRKDLDPDFVKLFEKRLTDEELRAMQKRGESKSDWTQAASMTEAEIRAAIASDPDEASMVLDWSKASEELQRPKSVLNMVDEKKM
ncbi:MAG: hypothetical protein HKK67_09015 [Chlorobiaceae bacterium]|nr:hypothetical protein [Chlorobiaceae bacterium]NMW21754.1 hypothetical protein [Chlorobiaceae bacterium]